MIRCHFPLCRSIAKHTPVVELPTLRTAGDSDVPTPMSQPTILIGKEVCDLHRNNYNWFDWMPVQDWYLMQEAARQYGLIVCKPELIEVMFKPIGWMPSSRHLEVER